MGEAARHGENPDFAGFIESRLNATRDASAEEISVVMAAMVPAVIATVRHFSGEPTA